MPDEQPHAQVEEAYFEDIFVVSKGAEHRFSRMDPVAHRRVLALFDSVLALNPKLRGLRQFREDPIALTDAVMGITTQFNLEDIVHFLLVPYQRYNQDVKIARAREAVEARARTKMFWKASPRTIRRIWRSMENDSRFASYRQPIGHHSANRRSMTHLLNAPFVRGSTNFVKMSFAP
jgi:hypothetical protein